MGAGSGTPAPAPAPAVKAERPPAALVDQVRALPRTAGDRKQAMALHSQAMKVHAAKDFEESERLWAEAARADPSWSWPLYNLACSAALQGRSAAALAYLEMMRDRAPEPDMLRRLETDADLASIRRRPEFEALFVEIADGIHGRSRDVSCPEGMVRIPRGAVLMGSRDDVGDDVGNEHPQHEVVMQPYCIDKTEVMVKAYAACVAAGACSTTTAESCHREARLAHPVNCVDWEQAKAYCKWAGKRLPTEAEWEYAARGNDDRTYPWGEDEPTQANVANAANVAVGRTLPVGSFPKGASPFGVLDMVGNGLAWTASAYRPYAEHMDSADWDPGMTMIECARARPGEGSGVVCRQVQRPAVRGSLRGDHRIAHRYSALASDQDETIGIRCARGD